MKTDEKPPPYLLDFVKSISEAHERNMSSFRAFFETYNKNLQSVNIFATSLNNSIIGIAKAVEQVNSFGKNLNLILPDITKIFDFAESIRKYREIEKSVLIESGWFICPSLDPVPVNWISKAVHSYQAGKRDSL